MNNQLEKVVNQFKDKAPQIVKDNKGALIGALIGYLLTDSEEAKSAILGAVAGAIIVDSKEKKEIK